MPTDPQDDIQIKVAGSSNSSTASQTTPTPVVATVATAVTQPAPTPVVAVSTPIKLDEPTEKPANQRAFNLDSDTATSGNQSAKPDKYAIPKAVQDKYPELVELIKKTESMDDEEREYWFQILPVMTEEQVEKFKSILDTEKQQLSSLDKEYEDELNRLNEKHLLEWKEFENKEKSKAIKDAEAADQATQAQMEEDLLAKLSDV